MVVLRAIGRFFARIGRWIKETAWIQPLLIVGGIFAIIFSIPYLTKWVKSWFNEESAAEKYFSGKKLSLKNADKGTSEVDELFKYLDDYSKGEQTSAQEKKFGKKFFLALVQEECESCEERYDGFKKLEKEWGKGNFKSLDGDESFRLHTIYVDAKNDDGDNLFENVYDKDTVSGIFEEAIYYMSNQAGEDHPYVNNSNDSSYVSSLENLEDKDNISTPTTFVFDLTPHNNDKVTWISPHGVREVLFNFEGTDGDNNAFGRAKTLRNAWGNVEDTRNVYSPFYGK